MSIFSKIQVCLTQEAVIKNPPKKKKKRIKNEKILSYRMKFPLGKNCTAAIYN